MNRSSTHICLYKYITLFNTELCVCIPFCWFPILFRLDFLSDHKVVGRHIHYVILIYNTMITNNLNNNIAVTKNNYREKICECKSLLEQITIFIDEKMNEHNSLPDDIPTTVCGTEGVMKVLQCGRSKATDIMNDPKYQSAFFGGKGTRKRLCDTRVLLSLKRQGHE